MNNLELWAHANTNQSFKSVLLNHSKETIDILYDELLARRKKNNHAKFPYIYIWRTKSGEKLPIKDMETKHLFNIIKYLESHLYHK